jgi:hypothetical protein
LDLEAVVKCRQARAFFLLQPLDFFLCIVQHVPCNSQHECSP